MFLSPEGDMGTADALSHRKKMNTMPPWSRLFLAEALTRRVAMHDMKSELSIESLTADHALTALRFCREAGWNQIEEDWRRLISYEPNGCFGAFLQDQLVGTVTTTTYGKDLAWIGMMLVDPNHRRQGIAMRLMQTAIDWLRSREVTCIKLDATPAGEFVYSRLGFVKEWSFHRWQRDAHTHHRHVVDSIPRTALSASLLELDVEAFGADRNAYLQLLGAVSSVVVKKGGFGMVRDGDFANYLGPVCATSPNEARNVIQELTEMSQRVLTWDIPSPNAVAESIARDLGFSPVRILKRMRLGAAHRSANLDLQYALADPATG